MPSSVIKFYSYDPDTKTLKIVFVSGLIYYYQAVPLKVYQMLKAAISKGSYFNHYIKDHYDFKKIEPA